TLTGGLAMTLYSWISQFVAYALTWSAPATYNFAALWLIGAVMCFFHLAKVGPPRPWLKGSIIAMLLVVAVTAQALQLSEAHFRSGRQNLARLLMPPSLRIAPLHDEAAFFGEIAKLKAKHDEDRTKARPDDPIPWPDGGAFPDLPAAGGQPARSDAVLGQFRAGIRPIFLASGENPAI